MDRTTGVPLVVSYRRTNIASELLEKFFLVLFISRGRVHIDCEMTLSKNDAATVPRGVLFVSCVRRFSNSVRGDDKLSDTIFGDLNRAMINYGYPDFLVPESPAMDCDLRTIKH